MIIICPECSTKFKINPDKIPAGGTKVRCARCRSVFAVEKAPEEDVPLEQPVQEPETSQPEEPAASDFSYERFQELDAKKEEEDDFSFGTPDNLRTGAESIPRPEPEPDEFSFSEPPPEPVAEPTEEPKAASSDQNDATESRRSEAPADHKKGAEAISEQGVSEEEYNSETEQLYQHLTEKKSSPLGSFIRILLLLILAALVAVGVYVYINGPEKLNDTIQQLLGQQVAAPEQSGQITLANLEGKFLKNQHVGEVFLIRGEAINNFATPRSAIQVKGIIFDQGGQPLLQKTVFCGNPISDKELEELPFEELEKMMGNQFGKDLSNMKVNTKQSIPFDIVFKDLPKNLSEFSVNVTASKPATN